MRLGEGLGWEAGRGGGGPKDGRNTSMYKPCLVPPVVEYQRLAELAWLDCQSPTWC